MSSPSRLALFGVIHMDRLRKVAEELETASGDAEALFIEYPAEPLTRTQLFNFFARVPAYAFGALLLQLLVYSPLLLLFNRDLYPTEFAAVEQIAAAEELPVHPVDEHPNVRASRAGPRVILANWLAFGVVGWLSPVSAAVTAALAIGGGLLPVVVRRHGHRYSGIALAVVGLGATVAVVVEGLFSVWLLACSLLFVAVVLRTVDHRNQVMLDRVAELSTHHGYESAVLVTGKAHLSGMVETARERGLTVPSVHISRWLRAGTTVTEFEPAELPTPGGSATILDDSPGLTPASGLRPLARRVGAAVADILLLSLAMTAVWFVSVVVAVGVGIEPDAAVVAVLLGVAAVGLIGYHVVLEWAFGTTFGKRVFGLVVVDRDGTGLSGRSALLRNLLRPVSLLGGYVVGGLLVARTSRRQHLGDRIGGTVVVSAQRVSDDQSESADETTPPTRPPAASDPQTSKTT